MGECIKFGRGKIELYKPKFADNSWSNIIAACQTDAVPDTWKVGDQKAMTINGKEYAIDIIGKNHDTYSDGTGTAPLTFQMHDCYATKYYMAPYNTASELWSKTTMRDTYLPSILALMPQEIQSAIKAVNKVTAKWHSVTETTADTLFLLTTYEVWGSIGDAYMQEGTQYAYYVAGNSKVKKVNGTNNAWWLRSPKLGDMTRFCFIQNSGGLSSTSEDTTMGVAPAFCF